MKILQFVSAFPVSESDPTSVYLRHFVKALGMKADISVLAPGLPEVGNRQSYHKYVVYRFQYFVKQWQHLAHGNGIKQNISKNPIIALLLIPYVFTSLLTLLKLNRKYQYDVVHAHWVLPQGLIAVIAKYLVSAFPPVLITSHGSDIYDLKDTVLRPLLKFTLKHADAVNAVSRPLTCEIEKLYPRRVETAIPMGTNPEFFQHINNRGTEDQTNPLLQEKYILFVGRLTQKKGLQYLLEAFSKLQNDTLMLYVVGSGVYKSELTSQTKTLDLENRVRFIGKIAQEALTLFYKNACMVVLPSYESEGLPLVIQEAMFLKCPVIATNSGGISDIVLDGKTGLLVKPQSPDALASAIDKLLHNKNLRDLLSRRAYDYVINNFSTEIIAEQYLDIYKRLSKRS